MKKPAIAAAALLAASASVTAWADDFSGFRLELGADAAKFSTDSSNGDVKKVVDLENSLFGSGAGVVLAMGYDFNRYLGITARYIRNSYTQSASKGSSYYDNENELLHSSMGGELELDHYGLGIQSELGYEFVTWHGHIRPYIALGLQQGQLAFDGYFKVCYHAPCRPSEWAYRFNEEVNLKNALNLSSAVGIRAVLFKHLTLSYEAGMATPLDHDAEDTISSVSQRLTLGARF